MSQAKPNRLSFFLKVLGIVLFIGTVTLAVLVLPLTLNLSTGNGVAPVPTQMGPCSYNISLDGSRPQAQVMMPGLGQPVGTIIPAQGTDFAVLIQPLLSTLQPLGGGNFCLQPGAEFDVSSSQTCNMTAPGQTCGLLIRTNAVFFTAPGYARENFGCTGCTNVKASVIKWTGTGTITCLICYGQFLNTIEWLGGGMTNVGVDGNGVTGLVNDCVEAFDVQDFNFRNGFSVNCITNDIRIAGAEPGGISNDHIEGNLFGQQTASTTGIGVNLDQGSGQSWVQFNFFAAKTYGYAIIDNGGNLNPFGNKIIGNHIEACAVGTGGLVKGGTCIYSLEQFDSIQMNTMFNGVDYDCIYGSAQGQLIQGNICEGGINQQNNSDGSCYATDNASQVNSFTSIVENNCAGQGGTNKMNFCVRLNGNAIANTHNITINNNRCSGWQSGGQAISLTGTFDGATLLVTNNAGNWQPPVSVTAGASVWTYTDNDGYFESMRLFTVNGINANGWTCRGVSSWPQTAGVECYLQPGSTMAVAWTTTAPVFEKVFVNP